MKKKELILGMDHNYDLLNPLNTNEHNTFKYLIR